MALSAGSLFAHLPARAQEVALSVYGRRVRRLRYGGVHQDVLARLRDSEFYEQEWVQQIQLAGLRAALSNAILSVPFYRDRLDSSVVGITSLEQMQLIPTVTKDEIRSAGVLCRSTKFSQSEISIVHTGGTTGAPLSVYCDAVALQTNYAFFERFRESAGVGDGCRVATFAGRVFLLPEGGPPFSRANSAFNARLFSSYHLSERNLPHYLNELAAWSPALIDSYPSSVAQSLDTSFLPATAESGLGLSSRPPRRWILRRASC